MSTSSPSTAGNLDGTLAAYAFQRSGACRDYSDDFIRRVELGEADRAEYKRAWYAAHRRVKDGM